MRRLVFCFDGSWNKLDTKSYPTNVVLVAESVLPTDREGVPQVVYYDEGVGTSSDDWFRGGAFGKGLIQNIREAYRFLLFNYQAGDEIFVFGFSRGAFTARSFIGFIRCVGILKVNDANQINEAWRLYVENAVRADDDPPSLLRFRQDYCPDFCISDAERDWRAQQPGSTDAKDLPLLRIRYCGVWDTVGSLGWKAVAATFDRRKDKVYTQHDTELSVTVEAARHAVALDERRVHFMPTLWRNVRDLNDRAGKSHYDADAPYQQKWFPGDHGSVGGGGPERGLSNAALQWVLKGAIEKGLEIRLDGRSQLVNLRYNKRAALHNTPSDGIRGGSRMMAGLGMVAHWLKGKLLASPRSGPSEVAEIHPAALRRWHTAAFELPEGALYRPAPLLSLIKDIDAMRETYVPLETKAAAAPYIVKVNDTVGKIARDQLGDVERRHELFALNRDEIDHIDDIYPGDELRMPPDWPGEINPNSAVTTAPPAPD